MRHQIVRHKASTTRLNWPTIDSFLCTAVVYVVFKCFIFREWFRNAPCYNPLVSLHNILFINPIVNINTRNNECTYIHNFCLRSTWSWSGSEVDSPWPARLKWLVKCKEWFEVLDQSNAIHQNEKQKRRAKLRREEEMPKGVFPSPFEWVLLEV